MKDRVVVGHIIFGEQEYLKLGGRGVEWQRGDPRNLDPVWEEP